MTDKSAFRLYTDNSTATRLQFSSRVIIMINTVTKNL